MARKNRPEPTRPPAAPAGYDASGRFARRFALPLALLLVLLALALSASDLRADPPPDLSWSTGPYTDDALNYYSARNMILYGRWKIDDYLPFAIYPLANALMVLIFKLIGIGFVQVKLLSVLCAALSVLVMYLLVKEDYGPPAGLLAALLLATCYPIVMYSRLAMAEPLQILFLLLTGLFYAKGTKRPAQMLYCGLFAGTSILLVKLSSVFLLPALAAVIAWDFVSARKVRSARKAAAEGLAFWAAGLGLAAFAWFMVVFLPARHDYLLYVLRTTLNQPAGHPRSPAEYLLNTFTIGVKSRLFAKMPVGALLGFAAIPALTLGRKPAARFIAAWFVFSVPMLGYMNYRPDRHELVLLPALVATCAVAIWGLWRGGRLLPRPPKNPVLELLYSIWMWPAVTQLALATRGFWGAIRPSTEAGLLVTTLLIAAATMLLWWVLRKVIRREITIGHGLLRTVAALLLVAAVTRSDFVQYFRWFSDRGHRMISYAEDLDRSLPENAVVTGWWAPQLLISSKKRALFLPDWIDPGDPVSRYGVTHVVSPEGGSDYRLFSKLYPEAMRQARVMKQYDVRVLWQQQVVVLPLKIYELPRKQP